MECEARKNAALTAVVEHGIRLQGEQGAAVAWAYMQAYKSPQGSNPARPSVSSCAPSLHVSHKVSLKGHV